MTNSETKKLTGYLISPQFMKEYQEQNKVKQAQTHLLVSNEIS